MRLTKNFSLFEFHSKDGQQVPEKLVCNVVVLATNLQTLRDELGESLSILSGYRSPAHNKKVGGAKNSMHLQAKAADLTCRSKTPKQLKEVIEKLIKEGKMQNGGIGLYPGFVHFDTGKTRRWVG